MNTYFVVGLMIIILLVVLIGSYYEFRRQQDIIWEPQPLTPAEEQQIVELTAEISSANLP